MNQTNAIIEHNTAEIAQIMERVLIVGDLSELTPEQRVLYYNETCRSLGLNPLTKPFDYIKLNGKTSLYAKKDCTDQLRKSNKVSIEIRSREKISDVYIVTARATTPDGRFDESTGVVTIGGLSKDALANALMKAETKAKRRVTLSICGLGMLDETEIETIPISEAKNTSPQSNIKALTSSSEQQPTKEPMIFRKEESIQLKWLQDHLSANGIYSEDWPYIIENLDGKDVHTTLPALVKQVLEASRLSKS